MSQLSPLSPSPTPVLQISSTVHHNSTSLFILSTFSLRLVTEEEKDYKTSQAGVTNLRHQRGTSCEKVGDSGDTPDVRDAPWLWTYWAPAGGGDRQTAQAAGAR